jgi:hypothetical protein
MQPGAPQKGGGSKVLLGLGIGCGIMLLLCCGIGGYGFYMVKRAFKIETTPAGVTEVAEGITDMDPPESFTPVMGMDMKNPMTGQKIFTMATYAGPNQKGMLVVAEFDQTMAGANAEQMKSQMETSMRQQQQQNQQGVQQLEMVGEPRDVKTTVRGQEATFKIQLGKSPDGEEYYQVQGVFQGKGGPGFLIGQFPAEQIDEEQTEAFVRSIK